VTKISQLSSIGDSLAIGDQFLIRDIDDAGSPNKSVTVSGITRALADGDATAPALAFAADKNTGIYRVGTDSLAVATNGTGRLFVDATGNVGVGTSSTIDLLTIGGVASPRVGIQSSTAGGDGGIEFGDPGDDNVGFIVYDHSVDALRFGVNASERLRITSAGLVGIGTSAPGSRLTVNRVNSADASATGATTLSNAGITVEASTDTNNRLMFGIGSTGSVPWIQAQNTSSNATQSLILNPVGGNVGIGTSTVVRPFHLHNTSQSVALITGTNPVLTLSSIQADNDDTKRSIFGQATTANAYVTGAAVGDTVLRGTSTSNKLIFGLGTSAQATLTSTGLGIGTTSPNFPLSIQTDSSAQSISLFGRAADDISEIKFFENDRITTLGELQYRQDHLNFRHRVGYMSFSTGGVSEKMRLDSSGRLLVGTSTVTGFQTGVKHIFMDGGGASYSSVSIGNPGGAADNTDINLTAWTGSGSNFYTSKIRQVGDGSLVFHTQASSSANGAGSPTERMRITSAGQIQAGGLGTAAAPVLSFLSDPNTGIYSPGADQFAIATGGTARLNIDASGNLLAGTGAFAHSGKQLTLKEGQGYVGLTASSTESKLFSSWDSAATPLLFELGGTERMRIDPSLGALLIGKTTATGAGAKLQTSDGITFPATQVASADPNTLDDYEEGTWTPAFTLGSGSVTYTIQNGIYVKTGRQVTVSFWITINTVSSPSGQVDISLPFTSGAIEYRPASVFRSASWSTVTGLIGAWVPGGGAVARIITLNNGGAADASGASIAAGCELDGSVTYYV
jgi:hypothetical protein